MKELKRRFCNFSFYDQQAIQETLEDMAEQGWMLEKTGSFFWTYRRTEPEKLRFSVTYFPGASEFDPGPTEGELTKIDYCLQDGWTLVTSWGVMQIFCNEDLDAVPIETEPIAQVENLCRSMKKNVLLPQAVLCGAFLANLAVRFSSWRRDPVDELSNPLSLYVVLMFGMLILACLHEIVFYFYWSRKARAAAQNDGVFLPIRSRPVASWVLVGFSILFLLLVYSELKWPLGFAAFWLCATFLVRAIADLVKKHLKKRGISKNVNLIISVSSVFLMTVLLLGLITAAVIRGGVHFSSEKNVVGTYELYGRTREIYNDPIPLEIEELADVSAQWSKEADHQETVLLSSTEYRQYALPTEGGERVDQRELKYRIAEVKWGFLYDFVKRAVLNSRQDEVHGDYVFTDHYEPSDASLWGADDAYQRYLGDSLLNAYLVCWGNRIVEIRFYWEPTPEQISIAAGQLKGAGAP